MKFLHESLLFHRLEHQSIVKIIGINFKSFQDRTLLRPTIITEYFPSESLKKYLDNEGTIIPDLNWSTTKKYIALLGIASGMCYLHEHDIFDVDLNPENILIDENYYPHIL